ncbi:hypothetical protein PVAP13_2KG561300 [Panicum virgatum]|uniref:Uncharacterized protein n=1 Tax=Panicum virgatum TaxID=38727 RepID=A0A8T0WIY0_PANVG|nr:hypothetical protein PVAP13_2KG561300 [Panicum virgatum]
MCVSIYRTAKLLRRGRSNFSWSSIQLKWFDQATLGPHKLRGSGDVSSQFPNMPKIWIAASIMSNAS